MIIISEEQMIELIEEIPSMTEAIRCCIRRSGLTDKQVYLELGIDGGQWSRIMSGQGHFPQDRLIELMKICRNDLPLVWLSKKCGYDIKPSQTKIEELLQKERAEKQLIKSKLESIIELLRQANINVNVI